MFQNLCCGLRRLRKEIIVERVRPEDDLAFGLGAMPRLALAEPLLKSFRRELRDTALERHACGKFRDVTQPGCLRNQIDHARPQRSKARPLIHPAKRISMTRTQTPFPVMGEKLSFVGGDVDVDRTISLAALAGEAKIQRFLYVLVTPAIADDVAVQHFPEMMSASARGMALFMRDHEAGAHGVIVRPAGIFAAALAHADATQGCMGKTAFIIGILEVRRRLPRIVIGAQPQVLVDVIRIDDLARIHLPLRVPDGLELAESLDQLSAEHFVEKFAAGLAIAMFAAEAAAIADAEIRSEE